FEGHVNPAAVGEGVDGGDCIYPGGVHRVSRSQSFSRLQLVIAHVYANNLAGTEGPGDLDDVRTHNSHTHYRDGITRMYSGLILHRSIGRHHRATENTGITQGYGGGSRKHIAGWDNRVFGQSSHAIHRQRHAIGTAQPAFTVVERPLQTVHGKEGLTKII